jgi:CO dehydrogenase/acetyl-CoA synthase gamma subunit (corrinoid Fe-S protein)
MRYRAAPGLYRIGQPDANSPVLVTANYKLTVDRVRKELVGMNVWLLVLDTKGVNVWCAAGKGTFGTDELVRRIQAANLNEVVGPRRHWSGCSRGEARDRLLSPLRTCPGV